MQEMTMVERVAARLWRADSEDAGVPASISLGRTQDAFRDQSDETRARWFKFARAAIEEMRTPTSAMIDEGNAHDECVPYDIYESMIDAALSE